ncbi:MAG: hypothetical protein IKA01_03995 [Alistipes sp.]|nr:hypothetical protein [Alistipes sp.]
MLLKYIPGAKPLTLTLAVAGGVAISADSPYNILDDYSRIEAVISNDHTFKYIDTFKDTTLQDVALKLRFDAALQGWKQRTVFVSSAKQIVTDRGFQEIVQMGEKAVPLIIQEIKETPSTLVWALNMIYQKKISHYPQITITEACKLWVKKLSN